MSIAGLILGLAFACGTIPTSDDVQVRIALGVGVAMAWCWIVPNVFHYAFVGLFPLVFLATGTVGFAGLMSGGFLHPLLGLFLAGLFMVPLIRRNGGDVVVRYAVQRLRFGSMGTLVALSCATALLSSGISNTATAAFFLPIVAAATTPFGNRTVTIATRVAVAYAATIGGLLTPIGTAPNAITVAALAKLGITVSVVDWMRVSIPVAIATFIAMVLLLRFMARFPALGTVEGASLAWKDVRPHLARLGAVVLLFTAVIGVWMLFEQKAWRSWQPWFWGVVAVFVGSTLLPVRGRALLSAQEVIRPAFWKDAAVLLLLGGGLALGKGMQSAGADQWIAETLLPLFQGLSPWLLGFCLGAAVTFAGELLSNTAMAALLLPVVLASAAMLGMDTGALGMLMGMCCSHGYTLLVATPPNAIMATGLAPEDVDEYQRLMRRIGPVLNIVAVAITVTIVQTLSSAGVSLR